MIRNATSMGP